MVSSKASIKIEFRSGIRGMAFLLMALVMGFGIAASATTYYIDNSAAGCGGSGCSDKNNGTSKTTAWVHAPGMPSCTSGGCYTIDNNSGNAGHAKPGDQFILRGGDVWHESNNDLPWTWRSAGSSGNTIYVGVDETWYVGSSWTRPVLNEDGTDISTLGQGALFKFGGGGQAPYNVVDNIEFINFYSCASTGMYGPFEFNDTLHNTLSNAYFHGWTHCPYTGTQTDGCVLVGGTSATVEYTVFDATDSTGGGDSCYAVGFSGSDNGSEIAYNYITHMPNGFVGSFPNVHDNVIAYTSTDFVTLGGGSYHGNAFENNVCNSPCFIYNNVGLFVSPTYGYVSWWDSPKGNYDYIFNNVIANSGPFSTVTGDGHAANGGFVIYFNNTEECGADNGQPSYFCAGDTDPSDAHSTFENSHFISSYAPPPLTSYGTQSNNITQTKSVANGQGYSYSQSYVFSPTASNNSTVGAGLNLTSLCNSIAVLNAAAGTACQEDTTYGVTYNATNHTVSWPARTPIGRPTNGAWDAGAYEYGDPPNPPSGLTAVVD